MHQTNKNARFALLLAIAMMLTFTMPLLAYAGAFNFTKSNTDPDPTATPTAAAPEITPPPGAILAPVQNNGGTGTTATDGGAVTSTIGDGAGETQSTNSTDEPEWGKTNVKGVNVRASASGDSATLKQVARSGTVFIIIRETENLKNETYYVISLGDKKEGYVRADLVDLISEQEYKDAKYSIVARPKQTTAKTSSSSGGGSATAAPTASDGTVVIATATPEATATADATVVWTSTGTNAYHKQSTCNGVTYSVGIAKSDAEKSGKLACAACW